MARTAARGARGKRPRALTTLVALALVVALVPVVAGVPGVAAAGATVSIGDVTVHEGDAGVRTIIFTVAVSEPQTAAFTVDYTIGGGDATPGTAAPADYHDRGGVTRSLLFSLRSTGTTPSYRMIGVKLFPDTTPEPDETFAVTLSAPTGGVALGDAVGVATIVDDDAGSGVRVALGDVSVPEGDALKRPGKVPVVLSEPAAADVVVQYQLGGGTATPGRTNDYHDLYGRVRSLTFRPGQVRKFVTGMVHPDTTAEGNETFSVSVVGLSGPATLAKGAGTVTIVDDDGPPPSTTTTTMATTTTTMATTTTTTAPPGPNIVTQTFRIGPFALSAMGQAGSQDESLAGVSRPAGAIGIKGLRVDIVDLSGTPVMRHDVHLHHVVFLDHSRADSLCSNLPNRFSGSGMERTPLVLGGDYAYLVGAADQWSALWHIMNMTPTAQNVYIQYEIDYITGADLASAKGVRSYFYDVDGCWGDSEFDVPGNGGPGSIFSKSITYTAPRTGTRVFTGGHLHAGGIDTTLTRVASGAEICRNTAMYMMGMLNSITACANETPISAGEQIRLTARYQNDVPIAGAMGIALSYVWEP